MHLRYLLVPILIYTLSAQSQSIRPLENVGYKPFGSELNERPYISQDVKSVLGKIKTNFDISDATKKISPLMVSAKRASEAGIASAKLMECLKKHSAEKSIAAIQVNCGLYKSNEFGSVSQNLGQINQALFTQYAHKQALKNLSGAYTDIKLRYPDVDSSEKPKDFCAALSSIKNVTCDEEASGLSMRSVTQLNKDINSNPPESFDKQLTTIKNKMREITNSNKHYWECKNNDATKPSYEQNVRVAAAAMKEAVNSARTDIEGLGQFVMTSSFQQEVNWNPLQPKEISEFDDRLKQGFTKSINAELNTILDQGKELIDPNAKNLKFLLKKYPTAVGQILLQYPDMLQFVCNAIADEAKTTSPEVAYEWGNSKFPNFRAPPSDNNPLKGVLYGTTGMDKVLNKYLVDRAVRCDAIKEAYKESVNTPEKIEQIEKQNQKISLALKEKFSAFNNLLKSEGRATGSGKLKKSQSLPRFDFNNGLGTQVSGCGGAELVAFQNDMNLRGIEFLSLLEKDKNLLSIFKAKLDEIQKIDDPEIKGMSERKLFTLLGYLSRLPHKDGPGGSEISQESILEKFKTEFGTTRDRFSYYLNLIVRDEDLQFCVGKNGQ